MINRIFFKPYLADPVDPVDPVKKSIFLLLSSAFYLSPIRRVTASDSGSTGPFQARSARALAAMSLSHSCIGSIFLNTSKQ